ncbi:hypothetical protein [Pseudalkalibacillus hwajinpoensis]|uniref:malate synthase n=1 Tax=Guptibacillus hwajinpoensis TaxID=208199 RepID=A0A4V5PZ01_9BACL|nr:hypothetical protein [Pseudalkalibacillus hwajinpoensis]TKD71998.1 hypothetical protein FBF83_04150 [Pseudalkalibacillus hwajinpoensis]
MIEEKCESVNSNGRSLLTQEAMEFLLKLHRQFETEMRDLHELVKQSEEEQKGFLPNTKSVRETNWTVKPVRADLQDRRVMVRHSALDQERLRSSLKMGARLFAADFMSDQFSPYNQRMNSHANVNEEIKQYSNNVNVYPTSFMMIPRQWNMKEENVIVDGTAMSAGLFDFGLYLFHNTVPLLEKRSAPYFGLTGFTSYYEARFWNRVFSFAEREMKLLEGTVKASVLLGSNSIYQAEEMLYELRDHCAGLHYETDKMENITDAARYLIKVGHKRSTHVICDNSIKGCDKTTNTLEQFELETVGVVEGFDGTCVSDINTIDMVNAIYNHYMPEPNQIWKKRNDCITLMETANELTV